MYPELAVEARPEGLCGLLTQTAGVFPRRMFELSMVTAGMFDDG